MLIKKLRSTKNTYRFKQNITWLTVEFSLFHSTIAHGKNECLKVSVLQ